MINNKGQTYINTAVKIIISVTVGGLLWWGFTVLFHQSFIVYPLNQLKLGYSYSDNKSTYIGVVQDGAMEKLGTKPNLPTIIPAVMNEVTNPEVPSAPTNPELTQNGSGIDVSWSAPLRNGGAQILGYFIYMDGNRVTTDLIFDLSYTIPNVNAGDHTIQITAVNKKGESTPVTAKFKTTALAPGAPTNISGATSARSITVSWKAPENNGGSAILGYNIYMDQVQQNQSPVNTTSYQFNNLKAGRYEFQISAVNAIGSGDYSDRIYVVLQTPPDPPVNTVATATNQTVDVSWSSPVNEGGSPILGYNVYLNNVKQNSTLISGTYYTLGSVPAGGYKVYVTAVNAIGESYAASVTNPISVSSVPGYPSNVTGEQSTNNSILVSWTKPADNGNSIITGYNVYIDGEKVNSSPVQVDGTTQNGSYLSTCNYCSGNHTIGVSAINGVGEGRVYYGDPVTIYTLPGTSQSISVATKGSTLYMSWTEPSDTGCYVLDGYNVYLDGVKINSSVVTATNYSFGILSAGTHTFGVRAVNGLGEGPVSSTTYNVPDSVNITGQISPSGTGSISGSSTYYRGATVTLSATPASGYVFERWIRDGQSVSYNSSYSFTATSDAVYTALFVAK